MKTRPSTFPAMIVILVLLTLFSGLVSSCGGAAGSEAIAPQSPATTAAVTTSSTSGEMAASTTTASAPVAPANVDDAGTASMTMLADYLLGTFTLDRQVRYAELIVYGKVTEVLPGQWNTADGKFPEDVADPSASATPVIYRTFLVEPEEVLLGEPAFGSPIAFMVEGGTEGQISGPVDVGDKVLVFGGYYPAAYAAGSYGIEWRKDAYHANGEWSIFKETDRGLTNLAVLAGMGDHLLDPATARSMDAEQLDAQRFDYVTLDRVRASVESVSGGK